MDEITRERTELALKYSSGINNPKVIKPEVREGATSVWHQYVLRVPSSDTDPAAMRDKFKEYLDGNGIATIIHYPIPPHLSEAYGYLEHKKGFLPITIIIG